MAPKILRSLLDFWEVPVPLLLTAVRPITLEDKARNYKLLLKHVNFHTVQKCYFASVFYTSLAN